MIRNANIILGCAMIVVVCAVYAAAYADDGPVRLEDLPKTGVPKTVPAEEKADAEDSPATLKPTTRPSSTVPSQREERKQDDGKIARRPLIIPDVPVTHPRGHQPRRKGDVRKTLPEDRSTVVARVATIAKDKEGWLVATFESDRFAHPLVPRRLLQCRLLQRLEEILAEHPRGRFRISGETTSDGLHAYLLLRRVSVLENEPSSKPKPSKTEKPRSKKDEKDKPLAKGYTAELIEGLMKDDPGRAIRTEAAPKRTKASNVESVAPAGYTPEPGREYLVVDRIVRVILARQKDDYWYEVRFESDNTLREPPMRVHPCQLLVKAIGLGNQLGHSNLKLEISGEITHYRGRRFLLLRKVIAHREMGRF